MRRREFITITLWVAGSPLTALAQRAAIPVIGFLHPASLERTRDHLAAFHRGLAETGFVEGRNLAIEYRWADGQNDRLPDLAIDLVRRQVAVIASPGNTPSALAAEAATKTIPVVFLTGSDPVQIGLVASLNHPSGNLTGVSLLNNEIAAKRLELVHELVPAAKSIAFLVNPTNPVFIQTEKSAIQLAARALGVQVLVLNASSENEIAVAFEVLVQQRAGALIVGADTFYSSQRDQLAALASRHAVPMLTATREHTVAGGLMSYGTNLPDAYRTVGLYTGRILKGEKAADLPVQQSTKIDLVINLKTAKALGITFPNTLLGRADEVIE